MQCLFLVSRKVNAIPGGMSSRTLILMVVSVGTLIMNICLREGSTFSREERTEISLGSQAVNCMEVVDNQLWCASGSTIHMVNVDTLYVEVGALLGFMGDLLVCLLGLV